MMLSGVSSSSEEQLWKLLFSSAAVFMHIIPTPSIGAIAAAACGKSRCAAAGCWLLCSAGADYFLVLTYSRQ